PAFGVVDIPAADLGHREIEFRFFSCIPLQFGGGGRARRAHTDCPCVFAEGHVSLLQLDAVEQMRATARTGKTAKTAYATRCAVAREVELARQERAFVINERNADPIANCRYRPLHNVVQNIHSRKVDGSSLLVVKNRGAPASTGRSIKAGDLQILKQEGACIGYGCPVESCRRRVVFLP